MRRKLLIGALSFLGLILILVIAVFWYIRSGRLDLHLQSQVIDALGEFGIRAEIGSTKLDLSGYRVTLKDLKLYAGDAQKEFGIIDEFTAKFSIISYLRQQIDITEIQIKHPQIWYSVDAEGKTNLDALHAAPSKAEQKEDAITFFTALFKVENAELHYNDLQRNASAVVPGLNFSLTPNEQRALKDKINHNIALNFDHASAVYQGKNIGNIESSLSGVVLYDDAAQRIDKLEFTFNSDVGKTLAKGNIESFTPLKYNLTELQTTAYLGQISSVFAPELAMKGDVGFKGTATGTDANYEANGLLTSTSDSLTVKNIQVAGLKVDVNVKGTGADYQATGDIESSSIIAEGIRVTGIHLKTDVNGKGDEYDATADLSTGSASGRGVQIGSIRLSDATIKGKADDFGASASLSIPALKSDRRDSHRASRSPDG